MSASATEREVLRQQELLRVLWRRGDGSGLAPWLREAGERARQGLDAYRGNAAATAERALAVAFPTVQQLIGEQSFAQLARAFWHSQPPLCGDLASYGGTLPDWLADDRQLAKEPYLTDVARVDWAVHTIEHAADVAVPAAGLSLLAECDPSQLVLRLRPALALVGSRWPVVTIWRAHRCDAADRFAPVRQAFAAGLAETALVARPRWQATVNAVDEATTRFVAALQGSTTLAAALDAAGAAFSFEAWLRDALREQWLQGVEPLADGASQALGPCSIAR